MPKTGSMSFDEYWEYWRQRDILSKVPDICESNSRYLQAPIDARAQNSVPPVKDLSPIADEISHDASDSEVESEYDDSDSETDPEDEDDQQPRRSQAHNDNLPLLQQMPADPPAKRVLFFGDQDGRDAPPLRVDRTPSSQGLSKK
ncbi:unnamed protein product [Urochloa humidicola]